MMYCIMANITRHQENIMAPKNLRALIAAAIAGTTLSAAAAQAQSAPPSLTTDEKAAINLLHDFYACREAKAPAFAIAYDEYKTQRDAQRDAADATAAIIANARDAASRSATIGAAVGTGMSQADAEKLADELLEMDREEISYELRDSMERPKRPESTYDSCMREVVSDADALQARLDAVIDKYGVDIIIQRPAP